jgi:hypothetical protein
MQAITVVAGRIELSNRNEKPSLHRRKIEIPRGLVDRLLASKRKRRSELALLSIEKKAEIIVRLQWAVHEIGKSRERGHLAPWKLP